MKQSLGIITSNTEVISGVNLMWLEAPDIATAAQPGQFITVCCDDLVLRRPFGIHQVVIASEAKQSLVAILFKVVGKGQLVVSVFPVCQKVHLSICGVESVVIYELNSTHLGLDLGSWKGSQHTIDLKIGRPYIAHLAMALFISEADKL